MSDRKERIVSFRRLEGKSGRGSVQEGLGSEGGVTGGGSRCV